MITGNTSCVVWEICNVCNGTVFNVFEKSMFSGLK